MNTISANNYRLALTARKTVVKFLKEIKVICFVESSRKRMWDKNRTSEWVSKSSELTDALRSTPFQSCLVFNDTIHSYPEI